MNICRYECVSFPSGAEGHTSSIFSFFPREPKSFSLVSGICIGVHSLFVVFCSCWNLDKSCCVCRLDLSKVHLHRVVIRWIWTSMDIIVLQSNSICSSQMACCKRFCSRDAELYAGRYLQVTPEQRTPQVSVSEIFTALGSRWTCFEWFQAFHTS